MFLSEKSLITKIKPQKTNNKPDRVSRPVGLTLLYHFVFYFIAKIFEIFFLLLNCHYVK